MKRIFVDTNCWIALNNKRDQFHDNAIKLNHDLLKEGCRYITTNYVLDETYTGLLMKVGHYAAVDFGERIRITNAVQLVYISENIEEKAWKIFRQFSDKNFSYTDCTSFVVMQQFKMTEAFTNDHHFEQMGFKTLLK